MSDIDPGETETDAGPAAAEAEPFLRWPRKITTWLLIATLAWTPFPLGSAAGWGAGLAMLLVMLCWSAWMAAIWRAPDAQWRQLREFRVPALLVLAALLWALVQVLPLVPAAWIHPLWAIAAAELGRPLSGAISINPWRTLEAIAELVSFFALGWIACSIGRLTRTAHQLLDAVIYIAAIYALYAIVLAMFGRQQVSFFYAFYPRTVLVSGPFMLHNSFATYEGIGFIAAAMQLVSGASKVVNVKSGARPFLATLLHFVTGEGKGLTIAAILTLSAVAISGSRAGFAALAASLVATAALALVSAKPDLRRVWPLLAGSAAMMIALFYAFATSSALGDRYNDLLLNPHASDTVRPALWHAAWRMITDAPLLGMGLGTFQDAYPLYGNVVLPYIIDRAHCDYLELAAGLGLPGTACFLAGLGLLVLRCVRGMFLRRRNRIFCLAAVGASVLVALHAMVDFSLQIPAVAMQYAVILGLGLAQSRRR